MKFREKAQKKLKTKTEILIGEESIIYRKLDLTYDHDEDEEPILFI